MRVLGINVLLVVDGNSVDDLMAAVVPHDLQNDQPIHDDEEAVIHQLLLFNLPPKPTSR